MMYVTIWIISFLTIAAVIIRPFQIAEAFWAVSGALLLVISRLILPADGLAGIIKGTDVYLFLAGMMLLAETAREEKLFEWLAVHATKAAKGSANKLFFLIYLVGIIVTAFLSNDATAVVLTPAVAAAAKVAKVKSSMPYLLICAFIANAASFILPISNPANLVIYGQHMPSLLHWLAQYIWPSAFAIVVTYLVLRFTQRKALQEKIETNISIPVLSQGGKTALYGIAATAIILLLSSAINIQLGLPTAITGIITSAVVVIRAKKNPWIVIRGVSWSVIPLVAGLFVIVEALNKTCLIQTITNILNQSVANTIPGTTWGSSFIIAFTCNVMNNLPVGLIAGNVLQSGHLPEIIKSAILIGLDLGPNLSIAGSLATILWLIALRRDGENISFWNFLKLGSLVMTLALLFAIGSLYLTNY